MADKNKKPDGPPAIGSREWHDRIEEKSEDFLAYLIANPDAHDKLMGRGPASK
jgi:hypothetical protein